MVSLSVQVSSNLAILPRAQDDLAEESEVFRLRFQVFESLQVLAFQRGLRDGAGRAAASEAAVVGVSVPAACRPMEHGWRESSKLLA